MGGGRGSSSSDRWPALELDFWFNIKLIDLGAATVCCHTGVKPRVVQLQLIRCYHHANSRHVLYMYSSLHVYVQVVCKVYSFVESLGILLVLMF